MITGAQIRMARGHLNWSAQELAKRAGIGLSTVQRMESVDGSPPSTVTNLQSVQGILESAGIIFIDANDIEGPGVRLKK